MGFFAHSIATASRLLNGFNHNYQTLIFLFNIDHLFAHIEILLFNTGYSIEHYSLICTQLNGSKYCYVIPIIQFCIRLNRSEYCYIILIIFLLKLWEEWNIRSVSLHAGQMEPEG